MNPTIVVVESPHPPKEVLELIASWQTEDWRVVKGFDAKTHLYARVIDLLEREGVKPGE